MPSLTLLAAAAAAAAAGTCFAIVAWRLHQRAHSPENRLAALAFLISWAALAVQLYSDAARLAIGAFPAPDAALYATFARLKIIATGFMIWGFGFYVSYLWTGRRILNIPILAFAFSHALLFLFLFERRIPTGVASGTWSTRILFETPPAAAPLPILGGQFLVTFVYYFLPPILIALAYLLLTPRFHAGRLRLRATAAALAVLTYHGTGLIYFNPNVNLDHWANPVLLALVLATAILTWRVYRADMRTALPPPRQTPPDTVTSRPPQAR